VTRVVCTGAIVDQANVIREQNVIVFAISGDYSERALPRTIAAEICRLVANGLKPRLRRLQHQLDRLWHRIAGFENALQSLLASESRLATPQPVLLGPRAEPADGRWRDDLTADRPESPILQLGPIRIALVIERQGRHISRSRSAK
jgi:hypothetical protein